MFGIRRKGRGPHRELIGRCAALPRCTICVWMIEIVVVTIHIAIGSPSFVRVAAAMATVFGHRG